MQKIALLCISFLMIFSTCKNETSNNQMVETEIEYTMPDESQQHEGTWLFWPHQYQFGVTYRNRLDATWLTMTQLLASGEKVHIAAYDATEQLRIISLLSTAGVSLSNIDFKIIKTDDGWARDSGPIYVRNKTGQLVIEDWGFNGWGKKYAFGNCNAVPEKIAAAQASRVLDLNSTMILEGGAIEIDGNGTLLATKSSVLNKTGIRE
jgi:agmatine deiminase